MCVSAAAGKRLVEAGIPIPNARIIYTGLDVTPYLNDEPHQPVRENRSLNLLYAGRLSPDKGVDTAIKAMAKLVFEQGQRDLRLGLAGSGSSDYENELRHLVSQAGLTDYAAFLGWVPPEEMPGLLREFDVLLVPSIWAEPFARVVLEGMIAGLVVVATPTGGTPEVVVDGENGLLFTPGDPDDLARKIILLLADPVTRRKLARAGQHTVRERFTMPRMIDEIERLLQEVAGGLTAEKGGL
jgi:glycosyltransferase involved in cell wall biosynthesis